MSNFAHLQWLRGYSTWIETLMAACSSANRSTITTSTPIPEGDPQELLQADALYPGSNWGSAICEQTPDFTIYYAAGMLGGVLPFRGFITIPTGGATKLMTVLHGMGSVPDLVMGSPGTDYHNQIGRKLAQAGYAVWAPYFPHRGDIPSVLEMASRLAGNGLSHSAYVTSLVAVGEQMYTQHFQQPAPQKRGLYAVSIGVMHAIHATTVLPFDARVLTGYLRFDKMISVNVLNAVSTGQVLPHGFNPAASKYFMPDCFARMPSAPTFFECGSNDSLASPALNRDQAFAAAQAAWPSLTSSQLVKHVFPGGHEVQGTASISWLDANM